MHLSKRIVDALRDAGLTARDLSAATHIHYSTLYNMMKGGEEYKFTPLTEDVLNTILPVIEKLVADGKLPIHEDISARERSDRLLSLLAATRN